MRENKSYETRREEEKVERTRIKVAVHTNYPVVTKQPLIRGTASVNETFDGHFYVAGKVLSFGLEIPAMSDKFLPTINKMDAYAFAKSVNG